jgi:flagellar motor switch protein FliN/FliY
MADSSYGVPQTLLQTWTEKFGEAWEGMGGTRPEITVPEPAKEVDPAISWYRFGFGAEPEVGFFVGSLRWEKIGAIVLQAAGVDDPGPDDIRGTCLEILNQAASALARTLTKQAGREILAGSGTESPAPPSDPPLTSIRFRLEETDLEILLAGAENLRSLLTPPAVSEKLDSPSPKPQTQALTSRMDLLLDVELPVSVSFGHAQLALKDVLKLTTGSIVELNRSVSEPVEIIVNNCVIARGEVVVVEGNFGVRIRHVVSRQERLQSLK